MKDICNLARGKDVQKSNQVFENYFSFLRNNLKDKCFFGTEMSKDCDWRSLPKHLLGPNFETPLLGETNAHK